MADDVVEVRCEGVDEDGEQCSRTRTVPRGSRVSSLCARHHAEKREAERLLSRRLEQEAADEEEGLLTDAVQRPTLDVPPAKLMLAGVSVFSGALLLFYGIAVRHLRYVLLALLVWCVPVGVLFEAVWAMLGREDFVDRAERSISSWVNWWRNRDNTIAL